MRLTVDLFGVVQGVGLRPTVARLARQAGLGGSIQNRSGSVRLELCGDQPRVEAFVDELPRRLPAPARIERMERIERRDELDASVEKASAFVILTSAAAAAAGIEVALPTDLVGCAECLAEVREPSDRRFGYPFTTCTRCGPRYTVVRGLPYDRERTTLADFPLCAACRREYETEGDRRYHAESIACPDCGPRLSALGAGGERLSGEPLQLARAALARGEIVAVRGLGGFLLACDALAPAAIQRLRERKRRPHKPLAVMASDLVVARRWCRVTPEAESALTSPAAPIVILEVEQAAGLPLELLTPDAATLGVALPTSPLHHLLARPLPGDPTPALDLLVLTSGNRRGEPICLTNQEAVERLTGIADLFLCHDREVNLRCDDSVCVATAGAQVWRRARGFAPAPVRLMTPLTRVVIAMGGELKNTIAAAQGREVVLSPHVGNLGTPEAVAAHERVCRELPQFLRLEPEVIAVDLHPDYRASRHGRRLAAERGLPVIEVQHHHAHARACMAEHQLDESLALVFDGSGLGSDGAIWGAELLHVQADGFVRLGTFAGVPLPGGDQAVREPARQLVARLWDAGLELPDGWQRRLALSDEQVTVWRQQCSKGLNAPISHAAGRLFDAVAAAAGVAPAMVTYEAQAAIRLEAAARRVSAAVEPSPYRRGEVDGRLTIDWRPTFEWLVQNDTEPSILAAALHEAVARAAVAMAAYGRERTGLDRVLLSGGVFCNRILAQRLPDLLESERFAVFCHRNTPPNDGGLALGQAVIAGS